MTADGFSSPKPEVENRRQGVGFFFNGYDLTWEGFCSRVKHFSCSRCFLLREPMVRPPHLIRARTGHHRRHQIVAYRRNDSLQSCRGTGRLFTYWILLGIWWGRKGWQVRYDAFAIVCTTAPDGRVGLISLFRSLSLGHMQSLPSI